MTAGRIALAAVLAALVVLAGCDNAKEPAFQGWVEADLIFVGPDEAGRIETLIGARGRSGRAAGARCSRSTPTCSSPTSPCRKPR